MKMFLSLIIVSSYSFAQVLPSQNALNSDHVLSNVKGENRSQHIPHDRVLSDIGKVDKKIEQTNTIDLEKNIKEAREAFKKIFKVKEDEKKVDVVKVKQAAPEKTVSIKPVKLVKIKRKRKKRLIKKRVTSGILVQDVPMVIHDYYNSITLPSGSTALATLMAGVEVSNETEFVNAKLDYAFLGPNGAIVELKGCHIWLQVSGNYNTERIKGIGKSLSCKTPSGSTFEVPMFVQLRDQGDEYIGKKAKLITRGKIAQAAMQFLQSGVTEFGKAMAAAQVTSEVVPGGPNSSSQSASNVTGSNSKYIGGQALAGASAGFLDWWINYYKSLSPTLAMAPGSKVFLTVKGEVQIPKEFFDKVEESEFRSNTNNTLSLKGDENENN